MKSTRKYLLAVCALAIGCSTPLVRAEQDTPPPPKQGPGGQVERILKLKEKLGLTEDQVTQIKKIAEDTRAAMKALHEKEGDRESKKGEVRKIMEGAKAKMDAVLTAEQKAKLAEMRKNRPEGEGPKGEKGPKERKGPPPSAEPAPAPEAEM